MIHAAETYRSAREADQFGVETGRVSFDYGKILAYKEETTDALVQGVEQLLAGNGVDRLAGKGTLLAGKKVPGHHGGEGRSVCRGPYHPGGRIQTVASAHPGNGSSGSAHQRRIISSSGMP